MVEKDHPGLSITRQCELLTISRSSFYYTPRGEDPWNLELMRLIDAQFLETPWYGARQMARHLCRQGHPVGRKRIRRLMQLMGLVPIYCKPRTSAPHPEHKVYPYLLRDLAIERPNQVWCADVTYIPLRRGFLYLVAIMDWASRAVLAWRLSNTMDTSFCVSALEEALAKFGTPEIFNTDQGSQFTSAAFTGVLTTAGIRISMDGRGRWMDNVFIERLWRSLKYEDIYLKGYADGREARAGIESWVRFYNHQRPHQALENRMPMAVWRAGVGGEIGEAPVDMTLLLQRSLDNASALPTYPPAQPQQQARVA
jgi:putative transposase